MPCAPEKAVMGDPAGARAGAGPGDRGEPPICPFEFCTVLMAWLMPLLMACTAMLRARCGFGGLLGSLLSRVGGSAKPVACGMAWRLAVGLLQGVHNLSSHPPFTHILCLCSLHLKHEVLREWPKVLRASRDVSISEAAAG